MVSSLPATGCNRKRSMSWQHSVGVITLENDKEVTMCDRHQIIVQRIPIEVAPAGSLLLASNKQAKLLDHAATGYGSRAPHCPFIMKTCLSGAATM